MVFQVLFVYFSRRHAQPSLSRFVVSNLFLNYFSTKLLTRSELFARVSALVAEKTINNETKMNFTETQIKWASGHDWFISGSSSQIVGRARERQVKDNN